MPVTVSSCSTGMSLEGAERELNAELAANPGSLMAKLGLARLHLEQGASAEGSQGNRRNMENRPRFCAEQRLAGSSAGLAGSKRGELQSALQALQAAGDIPPETVDPVR